MVVVFIVQVPLVVQKMASKLVKFHWLTYHLVTLDFQIHLMDPFQTHHCVGTVQGDLIIRLNSFDSFD